MNRKEFENSLDSALSFWGNKSQAEVMELMGIETARMVGFKQYNPHHAYDLFEHTLRTVDNLSKEASPLLKAAAFFHDIGKVRVALPKDGRLTFYGHPAVSAEIADHYLTELEYGRPECDLICFWISHHDVFIPYVLPEEDYDRSLSYFKEINPENIKSLILEAEGHEIDFKDDVWFYIWCSLIGLCKADIMAQADKVIWEGREINSMEKKLNRIDRVLSCIKELRNC